MQYECIVGVATSNGKYYWPGNVIEKSEYDMLLPNEKKKFLLKPSSDSMVVTAGGVIEGE